MDCQTDPVRVLVVDDESGLLDLAALYLERADDRLSVMTEPTAADGLARLEVETIDCIVSDYQMPGMDGLAFLEEVRAMDPDLPFILFTGKGSEEIAAKAINSGVDGYVQKEVGTAQYTILAKQITTLAEKYCAEQRLDSLTREIHLADGGTAITSDGCKKNATKSAAEPVSLAVVEAIAAHEDIDPVALAPPLHEAIDTEALDALFAVESTESDKQVVEVTFTYQEHTITVDSAGRINLDT